jgi:Poxvirus Late Transcription Factor VLTF3 like
MEDPFFKIRPTKRSNPEARTTLDTLHQVQLSRLQEKNDGLASLYTQKKELEAGLKVATNQNDINQFQAKLSEVQKEITAIEGNSNIYNYFLETGDILYQYYDIQEKISRGAEPVASSKQLLHPGSVLSALYSNSEEAAGGGQGQEIKKEKGEDLRRDQLLDKYLQKIDPQNARSSNAASFDSSFGLCDECGKEMIFSNNEALFTCTTCGNQEFVLMDSDKPSYKDPPREVSYYAYKRINHFNEWLAQFQAKESTDIPQEVYDAILLELKKERITQFNGLKQTKIKEILKKIKFNKYYEHIPHIINRLNGQNAPVMSREVEEKLRYMFKEIQPSFQKHCPKGRNNFLSYSFVLYKFCELLELDHYLACFPLLKNRDKLYAQDKIWKLICEDLGWHFIRSI